MNSLSWFLYIADVLSNLCVVFVLIALAGSIGAGFSLLFGFLEDEEKWSRFGASMLKWVIPLWFVAALIPGKNTMFAIAASELGERVAKSEQVQGIASDAAKALQQWIKKQIKEEK